MKVIDSSYEMVSIARFVILLSSLNLPMEKCNVMCQRLSLSNSINKQIGKVLQAIDELKCEIGHHQATFACKKWLRDLGLSNIDLFFTCSIAMNFLALDEVNRYKKEITKILQNKEPYLLSHLAVNGKDIQIILHLIHGAHSAQNNADIFKTLHETEGPLRAVPVRMHLS